MNLRIEKKYLFITLTLFLIELLIALFVRDSFIRPYLGDFLVVILIYTFLRAFTNIRVNVVLIFTLAFSFFVEFLQLLNFVEIVGLEKYLLARIIIGNSFSYNDLLAYSCGIFLVWVIETFLAKNKKVLV